MDTTLPFAIVLPSHRLNCVPSESLGTTFSGYKNATGTVALQPGIKGPDSERSRRQSKYSPLISNTQPNCLAGVAPFLPPLRVGNNSTEMIASGFIVQRGKGEYGRICGVLSCGREFVGITTAGTPPSTGVILGTILLGASVRMIV